MPRARAAQQNAQHGEALQLESSRCPLQLEKARAHQQRRSTARTPQQTGGGTVETGTDFIFLGSKVTAGGDCSHEIKRHLLLGRKGMTNLDSILKSRDVTLPTNICLVKAMIFPVVMYRCENWTIKKAEC